MADAFATKGPWLALAFAAAVVGWGWVALALDAHWQQVRGPAALAPAARRRLRVLGAAAVLLSLLACARADHPAMAALVGVMTQSAAAFTVAALLATRPTLLRPLARVVARG